MKSSDVTLHILYGVPCVGKSTAALSLAFHLGIRTVIHTDYVREVQRGFVSPEDAPALMKVTHNAWELRGAYPTPENIAKGFVDHVTEVATGVGLVVNKVVRDGFDAVVEGAHFNGAVIKELRAANADASIRATLLVTETADELIARISSKEANRAHGAERKQWRESVPIILALQDYLIADARNHDIQIATTEEWTKSWLEPATFFTTSTMS
ncbi:hypothetical protein [Kutzneria chonburiensis]|uniref:2-phosphoglycerate kinase n=1 Tax=Kutzneria chonburiensis TaxID=1483604 RepID=A0ABV6N3B4_9PSEU|nr:hypothetical protein [Kutzneria chonburiensis]